MMHFNQQAAVKVTEMLCTCNVLIALFFTIFIFSDSAMVLSLTCSSFIFFYPNQHIQKKIIIIISEQY